MEKVVKNYLNELFGFGKKEEYDDNLGDGTGYLFFASLVKKYPDIDQQSLGLILNTKTHSKMYDLRNYRRPDAYLSQEELLNTPILVWEFDKKLFRDWDFTNFLDLPKYIERSMKNVSVDVIMKSLESNSPRIYLVYLEKFKFKTKESKYPGCVNYIFHSKYLKGIYTFSRAIKDKKQAIMMKGDIEIKRK